MKFFQNEKLKEFLSTLQFDDVFLVGHPKSGNTWLGYMIACLLFPEKAKGLTLPRLKELVPLIHGEDQLIRNYPDRALPRVFRNENPKFADHYPSTIYIVRDPRAVLVSYFHHYRAVRGGTETADLFVERYLKDNGLKDYEPEIKPWDKHVREWLDRSKRQSVLVVRYEDLRAEPEKTLNTVSRYGRLMASDEVVKQAVRLGSFTKMKELEKKAGSESFPKEAVKDAKHATFIRKGKVAGWREELSRKTAEEIVKAYGSLMKELGYELN